MTHSIDKLSDTRTEAVLEESITRLGATALLGVDYDSDLLGRDRGVGASNYTVPSSVRRSEHFHNDRFLEL